VANEIEGDVGRLAHGARGQPKGAPPMKRRVRRRAPATPIPDEITLSRGLVILPEPLRKILDGWKTWEIRSSATKIRGPIALIESGSGSVVGTCELIDSVGPLTRAQCLANARRAGNFTPHAGSHAWVLRNARRLRIPVQPSPTARSSG